MGLQSFSLSGATKVGLKNLKNIKESTGAFAVEMIETLKKSENFFIC